MAWIFEDNVDIDYTEGCITLSSENQDIFDCIAKTLHIMAAKGTYNFSTTFKILNCPPPKGAGASYTPPMEYPKNKNETKDNIHILDGERGILKKNKITDTSKNQQIWKQRMSYLEKGSNNYFKIGLNLDKHKTYNDIKELNEGTKNCPVCGQMVNKLSDVKQFVNPFSGEHHNNVEEGFNMAGLGRKQIKACPKCITACYFSLFNRHIPFYYIPNKDTYLAIPNTSNLEVLKKIDNNLSCRGQYIDFTHEACTRYSTNIQSLPERTKSSAMLTLLHNIKNKYSKGELEELPGPIFEEISKDEFMEIIEWWFISKSYNIIHIKANEKIYDILVPLPDPVTNEDVYLIPDVLFNIRFVTFDENDVEKFYNGVLKLDSKNISYSLFRLAKESISKADGIYITYRPQGHPPLELLKDLFLDKIMEVSTMLDKEIREASREIAKSIGKGFSEDVGMMTKFAYSTRAEDFRDALKEGSFRLAKMSALDKNKSFWLDENSMQILQDAIDSENFNKIKNYFVSFMSIYALTENYRKRKSGSNTSKNGGN